MFSSHSQILHSSMRRCFLWCKLPALIAVAAAFHACGSAESDSQVDGYTVRKSKTWPNGIVPVCWENPTPDNAEWRENAIATVTEAYAPVPAIRFEGWEKCQSVQQGVRIKIYDADLENRGGLFGRLFRNAYEGHPRVRHLGTDLNGVKGGMILNPKLKNVAPSLERQAESLDPNARRNLDNAITVHEMGHVLGLMHEQGREDSLCPDSSSRLVRGEIYGPYDADSIMNYCKARSQNYQTPLSLSEGDIDTLRALYLDR